MKDCVTMLQRKIKDHSLPLGTFHLHETFAKITKKKVTVDEQEN